MNGRAATPNESKIVWLICLTAAIHVFVFTAAYPVFNELDEGCHFDLAVRYSHAQLPRGLVPMSQEASLYLLTYSSPEFMNPVPTSGFSVPFWTQPNFRAQQESAFREAARKWQTVKALPFWTNYQTSQPPLYYVIGGLWWRLGQWLGLGGLSLVYWLRFVNIGLVAALVWIGHFAARKIFPGKKIFSLGVPLLIAFAPVQAFYSVENDTLSPVCFGLAFVFLVRLWRADAPGVSLGALTGLALAAAFLTKLSNAPLIAVAAILVIFKMLRLLRNGKLHTSWPAFLLLCICAILPMIAWMAWMKMAFGDFTGSVDKLQFITWTPKPFKEWWHHPIFTSDGLWIFVSQLVYTFWQGNLHWHDNLLARPSVDAVYVVVTLGLLIFATLNLVKQRAATTEFQRQILWFSFGCLAAGAAFLAYLSIVFDFGICPDPSRENPYLAEGRLVLGAMVPALLLFLCGLDYLLGDLKNPRVKSIALGVFVLFMLTSEIATDWTLFASRYNWYHLR